MKSKAGELNNQKERRFYCNDWCCPCNDGSTGCFANNICSFACDETTLLLKNKDSLFDKLLDESYDKMIEGYDNPEVYEKFCEKFFKLVKEEYSYYE